MIGIEKERKDYTVVRYRGKVNRINQSIKIKTMVENRKRTLLYF